eukprot:1155765-Rhodomonas_salina.1
MRWRFVGVPCSRFDDDCVSWQCALGDGVQNMSTENRRAMDGKALIRSEGRGRQRHRLEREMRPQGDNT